MQRLFYWIIVCFLAGVLSFWTPRTFPAENETESIVIIGHKALPIDSLYPNDLKLIFKGERTLWPNNQPIMFILLNEGKVHDSFIKQYLRKTPMQYGRYWKRLVFSGRGFPPPSRQNEADVISYVEKTPGSIGYVSGQIKITGVKRIQVMEDE